MGDGISDNKPPTSKESLYNNINMAERDLKDVEDHIFKAKVYKEMCYKNGIGVLGEQELKFLKESLKETQRHLAAFKDYIFQKEMYRK